jgi:hypothetical protein
MLADKAIKTLRHILLESGPVGVGQATAGYADQVDKQGQPVTVVPGGDVDIDGARRGIAEDVSLEGFALNGGWCPSVRKIFAFTIPPQMDWIMPHRRAVAKASAASPPMAWPQASSATRPSR